MIFGYGLRVKGLGKCRWIWVWNYIEVIIRFMCKILCLEEGFGEICCGWEIIWVDNVVIVKVIVLYVVFRLKKLMVICWGRVWIKGNMLLMGNGLG